MSRLFWMLTVTDRKQLSRFLEFYRLHQVQVGLVSLARGTASGETLDYLGLEAAEKAVAFSVVTDSAWEEIQQGLQRELHIDIPGTGIVFTVPMGSIGGKRELRFLTDSQPYEKGEETSLKETKHQVLIVIANLGYSEMIMDAARGAGARGGTLIHARGVGMERAQRFLGVSLAEEKELILIVTRTGQKDAIMRAIMQEAGMGSKAQAIVFSLPVTSTAGLRLIEEEFAPE